MKLSTTYLVFVLCWLYVKVSGECKKENDNWNCNSLDDVIRIGYKPEWNKLVVRHNDISASVETDAFLNTPNLEVLSILGVGGIKYNAFKGMTKLSELHFDWNNIPEIKAGMITNLPIKHLFMYNCHIHTLQPRGFDNIPNLTTVYIHKNSIPKIQAGVFSYTQIEVLFLNENGIETIEEDAFFGMEKLKKLALERNFLTTFDPRVHIGNTSPNLRLLWLARNNLTTIQSGSFAHYPNLRVLLYHINSISHIEEDSFRNLQELKYLDISNNKLQELSPTVFPRNGLGKLDTFFIHNNKFTFFLQDTLNKIPALIRITIGGNPWKCSCYNSLRRYLQDRHIGIICDEKYFAGIRPVCIMPSNDTQTCEETTKDNDVYFAIINETSKDYDELPPLCKIYCDGGKSCYSHDFDVLEYN